MPFPNILALFSSPGPFSSACDFSPFSLGLYPLRFVLPINFRYKMYFLILSNDLVTENKDTVFSRCCKAKCTVP